MFKRVMLLVSLFSFISFNSVFAETSSLCRYHIKKADLEWVGFKTTDRSPVRGTFKKINYKILKADNPVTTRPPVTASPLDIIRQTQFTIDTSSVASGDSLRDHRLTKKFFQIMAGDISGRVTEVKGHQRGTIQISLTMNGQQRPLNMKFQFNGELELKAQGQLDILNFGANQALQTLNKECEALHKGKDGVSKTWSEVELKVKIELEKSCEALKNGAKKSLSPRGEPFKLKPNRGVLFVRRSD